MGKTNSIMRAILKGTVSYELNRVRPGGRYSADQAIESIVNMWLQSIDDAIRDTKLEAAGHDSRPVNVSDVYAPCDAVFSYPGGGEVDVCELREGWD